MPHSNTSLEQMLREFMLKYGHHISHAPCKDIPNSVKDLRMNLIEEEYNELIDGLAADDLEEIADGAADLVYVVIGTCISYGIPFERIFREVHRSNMTKTAVKAENGEKYGTKTPKGPDYVPPDIKGILHHPERHTKLETRG